MWFGRSLISPVSTKKQSLVSERHNITDSAHYWGGWTCVDVRSRMKGLRSQEDDWIISPDRPLSCGPIGVGHEVGIEAVF